MKTAEEMLREAVLAYYGERGWSDGSRDLDAPVMREFLDGLRQAVEAYAKEYHAAACREALAQGGPVSEERLEEIRRIAPVPMGWKAERCTQMLEDLIAVLDHMTRQYLTVENILLDFVADYALLDEEGRRRERAEILEQVQAMAKREWSRNHSANSALADLLHQLAKRGPAPEPMPGDGARQRVQELEEALRELRALEASVTTTVPGREPEGLLFMADVQAIVDEALEAAP